MAFQVIADYASRVLYSAEKSIDKYEILYDATLTCISFTPNHSPPVPIAGNIINIHIKTVTGETFHHTVEADTMVDDVLKTSADQ